MSELLPVHRGTSAIAPVGLSPVSAFRNARAVQRHARQADLHLQFEVINTMTKASLAMVQQQAETVLWTTGMAMAGTDEGLQRMAAAKAAAFAGSNNMDLFMFRGA